MAFSVISELKNSITSVFLFSGFLSPFEMRFYASAVMQLLYITSHNWYNHSDISYCYYSLCFRPRRFELLPDVLMRCFILTLINLACGDSCAERSYCFLPPSYCQCGCFFRSVCPIATSREIRVIH